MTEELDSDRHDRTAFSCGEPSLDDFLQRQASQHQRAGVSRTFVAVLPGEAIVRGYYSLAASSVLLDHLSEEQRKRLPRHPVPVALLGRLAVDKSAQGQHLGEYLLFDALRRVCSIESSIGIHAVEVDAISEKARAFYVRYGFTSLQDDPRHLYIPLKTVRKLGLV